ncbi:MAG: CPBP family intramembrane metalloprotease [Actinomycetota bacterium]|nr:CPBP family intramembrane metalloprotease [Actinomycetota bacterium]
MDAPAEALATPAPPRAPWRGRDLLFTGIGAIVLSILVVVPLGFLTFGRGGGFSFAHVGAIGIAVYAALWASTWYFTLNRRGARLADAGFRPVAGTTLLKMIPVTLGLMGLNAIMVAISARFFGDVPTAQDQVVGGATSITLVEFMWLFALGAIAAPIVEEFVFRGVLYRLFRNRLSVGAAVIASAVAFALLHLIVPLIPALLVMGIVLAALAQRYDSLYPAIVVHALNNAAALVALYAAIGRG